MKKNILSQCSRRVFTASIGPLCACTLLSTWNTSHASADAFTEKQGWMGGVIGDRDFASPTIISKFSDGIFYLRAPIKWAPSAASAAAMPSVVVPEGFVTDLASIPRLFWSVMPRDGKYADAAIVHDYLYWMQSVTKDLADLVFEEAMKNLEVPRLTVAAIYAGVRSPFGQSAWDFNREQKKITGESRFLKKFPDKVQTTWVEWKKDAGNLK